jgi:hypothetical protein
VKTQTYASLAAFVAHWRALKHAPANSLSPDERARAEEMDSIVTSLRPEERSALTMPAGEQIAGALRRHRERAELNLARELRARGLLAG